jgi:transposase
MQWKCLPVPRTADGKAEIHYTTIYRVFARWSDDGSLDQAFIASVRHLAAHGHLDLNVLHGDGTNTVAKKGGDGIGYSGHKHQKGEIILAIIDNNGFVLAPLPVVPANEADTVLLPEGLNALKRMARLADLKIGGSYLNLDGGFDSRYNRKAIFDAGLIPNIKENPRNHEIPKRGRKRLFNAAIRSLRLRVERTFAWEDKFKRLLLRFEFIQQRHYGMKLMAYTLINLRHFLRCLKLANSYQLVLGAPPTADHAVAAVDAAGASRAGAAKKGVVDLDSWRAENRWRRVPC